MKKQWLSNLAGTNWIGTGELWLDPGGNEAYLYDCQLQITSDAVSYNWIYEGETKQGSFTFNEDGAIWIDSWHQPDPAKCTNVLDEWGLFTVKHSYAVPSNPSWGWRSKLAQRPDDTLVLQMTNITPWGEEGRAVRMIFTQQK